jgi:uncharacterized tellurite resistance protein B-like protein
VFLHRLLDHEARLAFAGLAHRVLQSSGEISATEARVLFVMLAELELDVGALETGEPVERMVTHIRHPRARMAALLELLRLAYADGDMRPEERAFIRWVADSWGMKERYVARAEDWAKRHDALVQQAVAWIERAR